jgi:hypothetical protein
MTKRILVVLVASAAFAAPAGAAVHRCAGSVQTDQPNGGRTARAIAADGTTCKVAKSVARNWDGTPSSRDRLGRRWTYVRGKLVSAGIRHTFKRGGQIVRFTT